MTITKLNGDGSGDGYRLHGPDYVGTSKSLFRTELSKTDRAHMRAYLDAMDAQDALEESGELRQTGDGVDTPTS
ncbi:hypothetical protein ACFV9C_41820 [Kribbella sp. NPDC059898]|uniref:hypothetical protein n=1 Tax=Kribbella sp. NPDC059898 TaxID=3346995 RepID=UPI0036493A2E